ncbi:MAG TPA: lipopolysaccharide heptosyltransferase II [Methylomusa anaerophila]|uniref:lipopolysaccharide heptosyltransferase II n=1 Tax=Methylomusa anaerophila TaxID=1930071 RepID=A0A348AKL3_9FIRM|nr:lipopolysaccharide heptosyltransferase II [Methylomusa anaerophila]BBB91611.1 lipopolysaccharide core heptosyltransferase RfaQ [Methylomusa anaerophila]HML89451.1 lipopolysaccharide heptosyltransferase II [Methylomusa anaerophila]
MTQYKNIQYKNILVHSLVNIGDVLLSTSAVALLKKTYPQAKVTMMVRPVAAGLIRNNPVVDNVIVYDYKAKHKSVASMLKMAGTLREQKFDLAVSFDRKLRPALLTWLAGIPVRVGPDRVFGDKPSHVTKLFTHTVKIPHDIVNTLQAETYQAIVRGFSGATGSCKPVMAKIMPANEKKARELFATLPLRKNKIALCVKGTFPLKTWPKERFAEVIDRLFWKIDAAFFIVGAPEDKDYAAEVIALAKTPVANFCGRTELGDLAAVLKQTDLFITVDTGATHIGATQDVPMVVIYGCTSPKRWHPLSDNTVVLTTDEACCPCAVSADQCPEHQCMNGISVNRVLEKIYELTEER